tara:strand:+ start:219 stop:641 length:423 start_codon:yes stop_codon:yes gene_type:complete
MPEGVGYGPQYTASSGPELNIVGDWAYATITQSTSTSPQTMFDFETGAYVLVSKLYVSAGNHLVTADAGSSSSFRVKFNGINVALARCESDLESGERGTPAQTVIPLIIPPFTTVEVSVDSDQTDGDKYTSAFLTGRVYK